VQHFKEAAMGDQISINGNIQNSILNIKSTLTNVQQTVGSMPAVDDAARQELQKSLQQLSQALEQVPASMKEQAEAVASATQMLVDAAKADKPNKTTLEITGDGLKKAAMNLAGAAPAVVAIAGQVVTTILRMRGIG
jgi:ABC-type transporter Mla subunit MlaD